MKHHAAEDAVSSIPLADQGLELEGTLDQEPRLLFDRCFLGALHAELPEQLGADEGVAALFQMGFLHGLRDALQVMRRNFETTPPGVPQAISPRLLLRLSTEEPGLYQGSWTERDEAQAHLSTLGRAGRGVCFVSAGYTSGWLSGLLDRDVVAVERTCAAAGDEQCSFEARESDAWYERGDAEAEARLRAVSFERFRTIVGNHLEEHSEEDECRFDPDSPAIHVWGPVMVLPFCGPEASLRAVDLIGRDPEVSLVSVVVVDLTGALIDEGFGAAALEQVLSAIESWGAEPILAGVSPLSEPVVADLEHAHVVVQKDLAEAIASGFQIAQLQSRTQ